MGGSGHPPTHSWGAQWGRSAPRGRVEAGSRRQPASLSLPAPAPSPALQYPRQRRQHLPELQKSLPPHAGGWGLLGGLWGGIGGRHRGGHSSFVVVVVVIPLRANHCLNLFTCEMGLSKKRPPGKGGPLSQPIPSPSPPHTPRFVQMLVPNCQHLTSSFQHAALPFLAFPPTGSGVGTPHTFQGHALGDLKSPAQGGASLRWPTRAVITRGAWAWPRFPP